MVPSLADRWSHHTGGTRIKWSHATGGRHAVVDPPTEGSTFERRYGVSLHPSPTARARSRKGLAQGDPLERIAPCAMPTSRFVPWAGGHAPTPDRRRRSSHQLAVPARRGHDARRRSVPAFCAAPVKYWTEGAWRAADRGESVMMRSEERAPNCRLELDRALAAVLRLP